jgi:multiple antibiotic resistance protein
VDTRFFGEVLVTLLVIMDPPGAIPVFLAITSGFTALERRRAALVATATAGLVIALFAVAGQLILEYLKVSLAALQVSGGLLLLLVALQLLLGSADETYGNVPPEKRANIAMVPLGTPMLAGPGAIVAVVVFAQRGEGAAEGVALALAITVTLAVIYLTMRFASTVRRVIKDTGVLLLTRVAGVLLAAIAVQLAADGIIAFVQDAQAS